MQSSAPLAFESLINRGVTAMEAGDDTAALALFEAARAAQPQSGLPHFLMGSQYAGAGDFQQAEGAMATAVLLSPDLHIARYQLGLLQFSSGRAAVALLTWQALLALPATDPLGHFVKGFAALSQDRFDEALRHYQEGLALNTSNQALSGDIEKVIAEIRQRSHGTAAAAGEQPADSTAADSHVLLANYQQQGLAH